MYNEQNFIEKGWQCPVCGAVMSPRERVCINCRGNTNVSVSIPSITPASYIGDPSNSNSMQFTVTTSPNFTNTISSV